MKRFADKTWRPGLDRGFLTGLMGYQLRRAQVRVFEHFGRALADLELTPGQLGLLVVLAQNEGASQTELARYAGVERATLGEAVEKLSKRGLIARRPSPRDRRSKVLYLTDEGRALLDRAIPLVEAHETEIAADLEPEERRQLIDLLERLAPEE